MDIRAIKTGRPPHLIRSLVMIFVILLAVLAVSVFFLMEKSVSIADDGQTVTVHTFKTTVGDLLEDEGIIITTGDLVEPGLDARLENDQTITITRAFDICIKADNQQKIVHSTPLTVRDALHAAGVTLGANDVVSVPLDQTVTKAQNITVSRITYDYVVHEASIAAPVERKEDHTLERGITKTVQKGRDGVVENTYKVTYKDGVKIAAEVVSVKVVREAKSKIVAYGTITTASRGGTTFQFERALMVTATAYTATSFHTASGTDPKVGTIAVDPSVIPLGTKVYVVGYGYAVAEDTGGAIKGNKIDVFLESESACLKWGVKKVKIYILD